MSEKNLTYIRVCKDCGKVMYNVGKSRQRCDACIRKHNNLLRREQAAAKAENSIRAKREQESKKGRLNLNAWVNAAARAGMSYGKYVAMKGHGAHGTD